MKPRKILWPGLVAGCVAAGLVWYLVFPGARAPEPAEDSLQAFSAPSPEGAYHSSEPIRPLPEVPPLNPEKVALGQRLFHDTRLSADGSIACSSCHDLARGGADGRAISTGVGGAQGEINAPSVLTAALNFRQFWDGRAGTLEEQAGGPILNPLEMASSWPAVLARLGADGEMRKAFQRLYPDGLTPGNIVSALADFERTLPRPSRFDRWLQGDHNAITGNEQAGYQLFKKHGCVGCHQGVNVGGNLYQRFGIMSHYFNERSTITRADLGRYNITGLDEDRYVFKVPSLRNVALTAPYFHDGSVQRLEDAVAVMARYQLGITLAPRDIALMVDFLKTLTSEPAP